MSELAGTFRPGATKDRIISIEAKIKPMFRAVPQDDDGTLSHSVVQYVLHRFFMQRGWSIRGLEPSTKGGSARRPTQKGNNSLDGVVEWVPMFLHGLLEQLHDGRGISVRELAVLAATLEDIIHKEVNYALAKAGSVSPNPTARSRVVDEESMLQGLTFFAVNYLLSPPQERNKPAFEFRWKLSDFIEKRKDWSEIEEWIKTVRWQVYPEGPVNGEGMERIGETMVEQYGYLHDKQCAKLKSDLLDVESKKPGRVRLPEFYDMGLKARLAGASKFDERTDYLKALGALDESDPNNPHIIVPNYLASRPHCTTQSRVFMICCKNECEELMGQVEDEIKDEMAAPGQLLKLVATLSSDTVEGPRKLSPALSQRLHGIANVNGGVVPLHGRLFAQWMHHAFPRECPFPHEAGHENGRTPDAWINQAARASEEDMMAHVEGDASTQKFQKGKNRHFDETELPWTDAEELLKPINASKLDGIQFQVRLFHTLRVGFVFVALSSMAYAAKSLLFRSADATDSESKMV